MVEKKHKNNTIATAKKKEKYIYHNIYNSPQQCYNSILSMMFQTKLIAIYKKHYHSACT